MTEWCDCGLCQIRRNRRPDVYQGGAQLLWSYQLRNNTHPRRGSWWGHRLRLRLSHA